LIVMMFWYGNAGWPFWQVALMWVGMIAFWGLLIWAVYALVTGATRRPSSGTEVRSTAATMHCASWTSALPAARSTPMSTGGCVMCLHLARTVTPLALTAGDNGRHRQRGCPARQSVQPRRQAYKGGKQEH
jgi:uncharacterized oligopeptide transporter (OPT) family protein